MGIVIFGAVFVDVKGYPSAKYIPAGRNVGRIMQIHGGVSRNVAEDIANIELRPTFVSVVDETGTGQDVIDKLSRHMVDTRYIRKVPGGMGTWLAIFDNDGDVVASISQRPDLSEIGQILEEHGDEIISSADSVVVEIDMDPDLVKMIFDLADKYQKAVYAVVSNMSIALERRDLLKRTACIVCNEQEAGLLFSEEYQDLSPEALMDELCVKIRQARIPRMIVTMGPKGAVYAELGGEHGMVPPQKVEVVDTTGCGDSFFAGAAIGLTYGKSLRESCEIGTRLAASVIATKENVCPRFLPEELGLTL
ncbi:MAG: carbohydrate kinase family protein [Firmicutes bacterium]|nr:carbohydrate kinase family protein [Bacillota bacterium]